jgi:WbqC-like protein family
MKREAIIQSSYIPWKGFFDLIGRCDVYIIYDTAGFSKGPAQGQRVLQDRKRRTEKAF